MTRRRSRVFISSTLTGSILQALCRTTALKKSYAGLPKGHVQSDEEKALLRAQAAQKQAEKRHSSKDHESSAKRVEKQLAKLNEPQQQTAYGEKGLQVHKGAAQEGQKTFIPAYDVGGKQWTIQYINEDGTKRFAKNTP